MYQYRVRPLGLTYKVTTNAGWFKSGHAPHNKGTRCPEHLKQRISEKLKGRRCSPRTEFKPGQTSGERNVNWKGGITPINQKIRSSQEYKEWRIAVFQRDDYVCQFCGQRGGQLNADHIKPFAKFPNLRLSVDNGRTLCVECHRKTPTYGGHSK
jgi:5-methylcytosine-specific restriction endonuclease McrA